MATAESLEVVAAVETAADIARIGPGDVVATAETSEVVTEAEAAADVVATAESSEVVAVAEAAADVVATAESSKVVASAEAAADYFVVVKFELAVDHFQPLVLQTSSRVSSYR